MKISPGLTYSWSCTRKHRRTRTHAREERLHPGEAIGFHVGLAGGRHTEVDEGMAAIELPQNRHLALSPLSLFCTLPSSGVGFTTRTTFRP